jgi:hypothetical protein
MSTVTSGDGSRMLFVKHDRYSDECRAEHRHECSDHDEYNDEQ